MEFLITLFIAALIIFLMFVKTPRRNAEDTWKKWIKQSKENPETFKQYSKNELKNMGANNEVIGQRGGRYEIRYSKKIGKPHRHYF
tara:strand:+ start:321 stop:578 length:258 start_codon:yes stop_codon:yes gene_type:complete